MQSEKLKKLVLKILDDLKAENIVDIDVKGKTSIADFMVICSARSSRHLQAVADNLAQEVKKYQVQPRTVEGRNSTEWALVDLNDVIVHIMMPHSRDFYQLEKLWQHET